MINKHYTEKVLGNDLIASNTYFLRVTCDEEFIKWFRPGQFAHIEIPHAKEMLLRRPISINFVDILKKEVHFVYNAVGKGTNMMTLLQKGDTLDLLMPMGNGFLIKEEMKKIWLVGGGAGVAPLKSLFVKFPDREYKAFLGFRSKDCVYQAHDFESFAQTFITTDDGSYCTKGFCTNVLQNHLKEEKPDVILACGPHVFFKSLVKTVGNIQTFVSLEQHMGCGTGGCSVCVCKVAGENKKVCMQGPVFDIREVDSLYD